MSGSAIQQQEKDKAQKILTETIRMPDNKVCKYWNVCSCCFCVLAHTFEREGEAAR